MSRTSQWSDVKRVASSEENVWKYVFTTDSPAAVAESVLYRYPTFEERTVICCSTMSGCPVGCRFCGAGDAFVRSLTAEEIVSQPMYLFDDMNIDPAQVDKLQIMFMSMGEPLLNLKGLIPAMEELYRRVPNAALLISTSGPDVDYTPLMEVSARVPKIGLQFSVHESTDAARDALIPFKKKLTLAQIAREGERFFKVTGRTPFFNYCAHPGNTDDADAQRLNDLFDPRIWQATISVICERDESVAAANARQLALATGFMDKLNRRGYSTRTFNPSGQDDIGGGCGMLWYVQSWMKQNPQHVKKSVGYGLPMVHTPYGPRDVR
jgi:23S rRNA (adenine2503-C2)-methyltransferase